MSPNFRQSTNAVLDEAQLRRIQAMHRGFLYQHLYAVGILLTANASGLIRLQVERDQDLELITSQHRLYIQVKTRNQNLTPTDVNKVLKDFANIRDSHKSGDRPLDPEFFIVANVSASGPLDKLTRTWSSDTHLVTPETTSKFRTPLPPAWSDLQAAVMWCVSRAGEVPFASLNPETLVWKLAGRVLLACASCGVTCFEARDLPELFEQLVVQLHRFPSRPATYRSNRNEPDFPGESAVSLVLGFSGSGKTTWAAQGSSQCSETVAYFDIGDLLPSTVAPSLAREIAAVLMPAKQEEVRQLFLPGQSGLQSLRGIASYLSRSSEKLVIVLDNAHKMTYPELVAIIGSVPPAKWILLAQPWPGRATLESALDVATSTLSGWSIEEIAAEFADRKCSINPPLAERINQLTGGLPLYVQGLARMCATLKTEEVDALLTRLEKAIHTQSTGQEQILGEIQHRLSSAASLVAAVLVNAEVSLNSQECVTIVSAALGVTEPDAASAIRELREWGVLEELQDRSLYMHDAFKIIAKQLQRTASADVFRRSKELIIDAFLKNPGLDRFRVLCRLLPQVGRTAELVDIATSASEYFREVGMAREYTAVLEDAASSDQIPGDDRFWAMDTVVFWKLGEGEIDEAKRLLTKLELLVSSDQEAGRQTSAIAIKKMLISGYEGDGEAVDRQFLSAQKLSESDEFQRILTYNYGMCLFKLGRYRESEAIITKVIDRYYDLLTISPKFAFGKNSSELRRYMKEHGISDDDIKRLADALELNARNIERQERDPRFNRIHALKFYVASDSRGSAVRVARDLVDEFLDRGDAEGARLVAESTLLPLFPAGEATDLFVPIHSQYAVVLAYCGRFVDARKVMKDLDRFLDASPEWEGEVRTQRRMIESIASGEISLRQRPMVGNPFIVPSRKEKVGRNDLCPCGSGKKYKKCHGFLLG